VPFPLRSSHPRAAATGDPRNSSSPSSSSVYLSVFGYTLLRLKSLSYQVGWFLRFHELFSFCSEL
jgi:hypothetical protein